MVFLMRLKGKEIKEKRPTGIPSVTYKHNSGDASRLLGQEKSYSKTILNENNLFIFFCKY